MRTISIALALILLSGAALAQSGGGGSGSAGTSAAGTTSGSATTNGMGGTADQPMRRQPRPSDFPPGYLDNTPARTPAQEALDRKLQICRGC